MKNQFSVVHIVIDEMSIRSQILCNKSFYGWFQCLRNGKCINKCSELIKDTGAKVFSITFDESAVNPNLNCQLIFTNF